MYVQSWSFGRWQFPSLPHLGHCLQPAQPQASNLLSRMVSIQTQTFVCKSLNLWHLRTTYSGSQTWIWNLFLHWHKDAAQRAHFSGHLSSPQQTGGLRRSQSSSQVPVGSSQTRVFFALPVMLVNVCMFVYFHYPIGITSGDREACKATGAPGPQDCAGERKQKKTKWRSVPPQKSWIRLKPLARCALRKPKSFANLNRRAVPVGSVGYKSDEWTMNMVFSVDQRGPHNYQC